MFPHAWVLRMYFSDFVLTTDLDNKEINDDESTLQRGTSIWWCIASIVLILLARNVYNNQLANSTHNGNNCCRCRIWIVPPFLRETLRVPQENKSSRSCVPTPASFHMSLPRAERKISTASVYNFLQHFLRCLSGKHGCYHEAQQKLMINR